MKYFLLFVLHCLFHNIALRDLSALLPNLRCFQISNAYEYNLNKTLEFASLWTNLNFNFRSIFDQTSVKVV